MKYACLAVTARQTLFFPRAGYISSGNDANLHLRYSDGVGRVGNYWSSTIRSETIAYYLFFNDTDVLPSFSNFRYFGFSVRCLVN